MKVHRLLLAGCRQYSAGSKKLTVTFEERNDTLKTLKRSTQYPLLGARKPNVPRARVKEIVGAYAALEHTPIPETAELEVLGRVCGLRQAGKGLMFLDLHEGGSRVQVVMNAKKLGTPLSDEQKLVHTLLRPGDSISAVGKPWRTRAGELSLLSTEPVELLSPSLHPLPDSSASKTVRKHNRVAELKTFAESRDILVARSAIVQYLSDFLKSRDFVQVQTPHLSAQEGGASAKSFETKMENGGKLFLRVAPELWLKRLIIGGFDRVFEVGNSYRNEGVDSTHNPEFTTCEFYMSFATLDDLIVITKDLLYYIAAHVAADFPQYAKFCAPILDSSNWRVLDFIPELENAISKPIRLDSTYLRELCAEASIAKGDDDDVAKLLDRLAGHYLEATHKGPTFIINHPSIMSPLAKESPSANGIPISRRFELFIDGREYVNAYEEENDPETQLTKLRAQNPKVPDRSFVEALEWGLPPTGGWGLGVDRLVMLLTGSERIGDVLAFGDLVQVQRL